MHRWRFWRFFHKDSHGPGELRPATDVRASAHDEGLVLLHIPTGRVYRANRTGSRIWEGLTNGWDIDRISGEMGRDYGVAEPLVKTHTARFVADLERCGFLTRTAGAHW